MTGKRITNTVVKACYGNRLFLKWAYKRQRQAAKTRNQKGSLLVVGDLNIGDAINLQIACSTLKQIFPGRDIHYAIHYKADALMRHHPHISRILPIFSGAAIPTDHDLDRLKNLIRQEDYALIFNFCPFFGNHALAGSQAKVLNHFPLSMEIAHRELHTSGVNHLRVDIFHYLTHLFADRLQDRQPVLKEAEVFINDEALEASEHFLIQHGLWGKTGLVLFNPDATSRFTRLPEAKQLQLLNHLLASEKVSHLLMGSGFVFQNVELQLLDGLEKRRRKKVTVVPKHFSLETYAALLDHCDGFITNDSGPLHLAAARKKTTSGRPLRNQTAIFAVFGATPARIYAYDSENAAYLPAPQDAPSHVFVAPSRCRNITCINKLSKRCKRVRCFDGLAPERMAAKIIETLDH